MSGFNNIPSKIPPAEQGLPSANIREMGALYFDDDNEMRPVVAENSQSLSQEEATIEQIKNDILPSANANASDFLSDIFQDKVITYENIEPQPTVRTHKQVSLKEVLSKIDPTQSFEFIHVSSDETVKQLNPTNAESIKDAQAILNGSEKGHLFVSSNLSDQIIEKLKETYNPGEISILDSAEFSHLKQIIFLRIEQKKKDDSKKQEKPDYKTPNKATQKAIIYEFEEQENIDEEESKKKDQLNLNRPSRKKQIEKINIELLMKSQLKRKEEKKEEEEFRKKKQDMLESEIKKEIKNKEDRKKELS